MIAVDNLLNETELEVVVYSGQLDLIVDTLGQSPRSSHNQCCYFYFRAVMQEKLVSVPATFFVLLYTFEFSGKRQNTPSSIFPAFQKTQKCTIIQKMLQAHSLAFPA